MKIMNYTRRDESWLPHRASAARDEVFKIMLDQLCSCLLYTSDAADDVSTG